MKRDMDLIRRIALALEELPSGESLKKLEGVDSETFALHATWMQEAGLIKATIQEFFGGNSFVDITRLTWAGCDFASSVRDDTLWNKAKANVLKPGMSFTFDVLKSWLKTEITQGFPTMRTLGQ